MRTSRAVAATVLTMVALLVGCSPGSPSPSPQTSAGQPVGTSSASAEPAFASVDCPDEVALVMIVVPACGYLTVPERRDRPGGNTIRIFVIRIDPTDGAASGDAMVVVGETLGRRIEYGGVVQLAQRTGRSVYVVDRRGTGLSEPPLGCPEVTAATPAILALPSRDPGATDALVAAVRACRSRLTLSGVDVSAYGLHESALDIEELRGALGLEPWNVIAFGSASRLAIEVARVAPAGARTLILDSPVLPEGPDPIFAADATAHAIEQLALACAADTQCADEHPDVRADLEEAMRMLDEHPTALHVEPTPGEQGTVVVDGTRFGRAARHLLGANGGGDAGNLLAALSAVLDGGLGADDRLVQVIVGSDPLCLGYVPACDGIEHGSLLTTACSEVLPFIERESELVDLGSDVPGMAGVFEENPYFAVCDAWEVAPDPRASESVQTEIPALFMAGQFDPFTGPIAMVEAGARLSRAMYLEVPNHSYNVFGYDECPRLVRREWLDNPDAVPVTDCFAEMRTVRLSP